MQQLGHSIWAHEQSFWFGVIPMWHRMTIIRLADGKLVLHSPIRLNAELRAELDALGSVAAIVAPSWWHDLYLRDCIRSYPMAHLYGAKALVRWNKSLPFTDVLSKAVPAIWKTDVEQHELEGIGLFLDEVIFYHRPCRSLILADLLLNFSENDASITRFLARFVIGPYPGCRFAYLYRPIVLDRRRFRASIERILDWDFDQIIVGHGAVVPTDGKDVFRAAFRWLLK